MNDTVETEARRGRPPEPRENRAEEETEARRRRTDTAATDPSLRRFGVPDSFIEPNKYVYRAALDDGMRLSDLTERDDYDFVLNKGGKAVKGAAKDSEGVLRYQAGHNLDGSPQYTYLLRKPIKFAEEDRARSVDKINAEEKARLTERPGDAPDKSYTPKR